MRPACRLLLVPAVLASLAACAPKAAPPIDTSADVAALRVAQDRELAVVTSGNVDTALTVYAADVQMMPPNEAALTGHDAMRAWLDGLYKSFTATGKYDGFDAEVIGDVAIVRYTGELTLTEKKAGAKPMTEKIKGIHVYRRQADKSWKIAADVWNTDAPPAPPGK